MKKERQIAHSSTGGANKASLARFRGLINDPMQFRVIELDNLGREADTYLHHIVTNYETSSDTADAPSVTATDSQDEVDEAAVGAAKGRGLADITIFLPASCMNDVKIEHTTKIFQRVSDTNNTVLAGQWIVPSVRGRLGPFMIKKWKGTDSTNAGALPTVHVLPATRRPYSNWYDHFFGNITVHIVCYYSMFAVSTNHIKHRTVDYYKDLLAEVHVSSNPETGHFMERSWAAVFYPVPEECIYAARPTTSTSSSHSVNTVEKVKALKNSSLSSLLARYKGTASSSTSGSGVDGNTSTRTDVSVGSKRSRDESDTPDEVSEHDASKPLENLQSKARN